MGRLSLCLAALTIAAAPLDAGAGITRAPQVETTAGVTLEGGWGLWFVQLAAEPSAAGGDPAILRRGHASFRAAATQAGLRYRERHAFGSLWDGLALAVHPGDVRRLETLPGVTAVFPVVGYPLPQDLDLSETELLTALAMTGADVAQNRLGLTGAGIRVGVIDTGVDYDHSALGGDGVARTNSSRFPNARVVAGWDFVGDDFDGTNEPAPDPYPDDCNGHGTHVAGIVAADGIVRGVAPHASLGAYRVFGCFGETTADIILAAMEQALDDGMQVVNLSIGDAYQWPQYPTASAADRLVQRGVVVVAAAGNNGTAGVYATTAPGVGTDVISVASFDNTHVNLPAFTLSTEPRPIAFTRAFGAPPAPSAGGAPLARPGDAGSDTDACSPLAPGSLSGRAALVGVGGCEPLVKVRHAEEAGAVAVVLFNDNPGGIFVDVTATPPVGIPVVAISQADGERIVADLAAGPATLQWGATASLPNATGGALSPFTAFGVSPDLALKPDLGAPGGFVLSTLPLERGGYGSNSGTSMSTPHVAGAVALLLEARPHTPVRAVRDLLQTNAVPHPWPADSSFADAVHHQGAGMLDIAAAVTATTRITPGKLSLGESQGGAVTRRLTITNDARRATSYTLTNLPAVGTGPDPFVVSYEPLAARVAFSRDRFTVPAGGTATVDVTIAPASGQSDHALYGGYVAITADDGSRAQHVPYVGFCGDYQSLPTLAASPFGYPWLAKGAPPVNQPAGATFAMTPDDLPEFVIHLDHQASELRMDLFDAASGRSWHRMFRERYVPRNATFGSAFVFVWDGTTQLGNGRGARAVTVPDGSYRAELSALRALADPKDPSSWDTWTSPVITIARASATRPAVAARAARVESPGALALAPAEPNPFTSDVALRFALPASGPVDLEVFDPMGRRLRSWRWELLGAGEHQVRWDGRADSGSRAPAGMLLVRLTALGRTVTSKLVRLP
jgi:subtilisin family serine protease